MPSEAVPRKMPSKLELDAYDSMKQTRATLRASNRDLAMETSKSAELKMQSVKDLRVSFRQPFGTPVPGHGELN